MHINAVGRFVDSRLRGNDTKCGWLNHGTTKEETNYKHVLQQHRSGFVLQRRKGIFSTQVSCTVNSLGDVGTFES